MMQKLSHHIEEEENEMFPAAEKFLDKKQAEELGKKFQEQKSKQTDVLKKGK